MVGLDISEAAIAKAREFPAVGDERYVLGDLFDLPEDLRGTFDWVFEHTCLSALPPEMRGGYVEAFHSALKPGGQVLAIFFLTPWDEGEVPEPPPFGVTSGRAPTRCSPGASTWSRSGSRVATTRGARAASSCGGCGAAIP